MMRMWLAILWLSVCAAPAAHAVGATSYAAATPAGAWREARDLYDRGRYADALRRIDRALVTEPDNADLLWLKAATLERSDHADDAIALYEHVARMYPDLAPKMRGDYSRALARAGRLNEANALFRAVLAESPQDPEALSGFARVLNWQGRHRAAAEMFRALQRTGAGGPDADVDLGWADYWAGRPDRARVDAERVRAARPADASARRLLRALDRDTGSGPTIGVSNSSDNDGLDVTTFSARQRVASAKGRTLVHLGVRQDDVRREGVEFTLWRAGAGLEHVWTAAVSTHLFADVLGDGPAGVHRIFGSGWITVTPTERWRVDLAGASDQVLTIDALGADVRVATAAASVDWRITDYWSAGARGARDTYSDDNTQLRVSGQTRLRILGNAARSVSLTTDIAVLSSDREPGTGYYAPKEYTEAAGGLAIALEPWTAFVLQAHGRVGVLRENSSDAENFGTYIASAEGMLLPHVYLGSGVSGGDSNLSSPSGYSRTRVWAEMGARF